MQISWVTAVALLFSLPMARAADPKKSAKPKLVFEEHFCRPGEEILDSTRGCMDNRVFVDAADDCLDRLKATANRISKEMKGGFSKDLLEKQTGKFSAANEDYVYASQSLGDLVKLTNQVLDEVDGYADYINLPEDTFNEELTGGDTEAYVDMHPCYSETRDSLDEIQNDLDDMKQEFEAGKAAADAGAAASASRGANLDVQANSVPGTGSVKSTKGAGTGKVPQGKSKKSASDITGVQEDQQKAKKK